MKSVNSDIKQALILSNGHLRRSRKPYKKTVSKKLKNDSFNCFIIPITNCKSPLPCLSLSEFSRYSSAVMVVPSASKSKVKSLSVHTKSGKKLTKSAESSVPFAAGEDFALIRSVSSVT